MKISRVCLLEQIKILIANRGFPKVAAAVAILILIAGKAAMARCRAIFKEWTSLENILALVQVDQSH